MKALPAASLGIGRTSRGGFDYEGGVLAQPFKFLKDRISGSLLSDLGTRAHRRLPFCANGALETKGQFIADGFRADDRSDSQIGILGRVSTGF